jgi:hypothetical protein
VRYHDARAAAVVRQTGTSACDTVRDTCGLAVCQPRVIRARDNRLSAIGKRRRTTADPQLSLLATQLEPGTPRRETPNGRIPLRRNSQRLSLAGHCGRSLRV